jgi:hypothetical protein
VSGISQNQRMREALQITEGNLTRMIGSRFTPSTVAAPHFIDLMTSWRDMCRQAAGHFVEPRECICARCGIRHGLTSQTAEF